MKMNTIVMSLCFVATLGIGTAYAHPGHGYHHHNPPHHHHDDDVDPFAMTLISESVTLTELSEASSESQKVAIINANADAVAVLDGGAATDLFLNGKASAEAVLKTTFSSDEQAALVILELSEAFQE